MKKLYIKLSLISAISFLLMFFEFPLPIFPIFLKLDISDLPALVTSILYGPLYAIIVELIKNILHGILIGHTYFIGETANFIIGSTFVFSAGFFFKILKKINIYILLWATIIMAITASILNLYIFLPLYEKIMGFPIENIIKMTQKTNPYITNPNQLIIYAILPFNIIKGILISFLYLLLKNKIKILEKE